MGDESRRSTNPQRGNRRTGPSAARAAADHIRYLSQNPTLTNASSTEGNGHRFNPRLGINQLTNNLSNTSVDDAETSHNSVHTSQNTATGASSHPLILNPRSTSTRISGSHVRNRRRATNDQGASQQATSSSVRSTSPLRQIPFTTRRRMFRVPNSRPPGQSDNRLVEQLDVDSPASCTYSNVSETFLFQ